MRAVGSARRPCFRTHASTTAGTRDGDSVLLSPCKPQRQFPQDHRLQYCVCRWHMIWGCERVRCVLVGASCVVPFGLGWGGGCESARLPGEFILERGLFWPGPVLHQRGSCSQGPGPGSRSWDLQGTQSGKSSTFFPVFASPFALTRTLHIKRGKSAWTCIVTL